MHRWKIEIFRIAQFEKNSKSNNEIVYILLRSKVEMELIAQ